MKKEDKKQRKELRLLVTIFIFIVLFIALTLSALVIYILVKFKLLTLLDNNLISMTHLIILMTLVSWILGGTVSFILLHFSLRPINYFISQMNRLTKGDYKTRIKKMPVLPDHPTVIEVTNSFNKLAEELENTEMLRSDFINNFSHEFKTPIVSIAGFAKLLKRADLSEEQRKEYIDIIELESLRLSTMATNVLNMTKVENQGILSDITRFNVSEQIRNCFLLLEKNWEKRDIDFNVDFEEYYIEGNEKLLKHVWLNLIDNAIKFTPEQGFIDVSIEEKDDCLKISILNTGSEIPLEAQDKIFNKFYQVDQSHSVEGNGIGLSLVKKITELHQGSVELESTNNKTTFIITLPKLHN